MLRTLLAVAGSRPSGRSGCRPESRRGSDRGSVRSAKRGTASGSCGPPQSSGDRHRRTEVAPLVPAEEHLPSLNPSVEVIIQVTSSVSAFRTIQLHAPPGRVPRPTSISPRGRLRPFDGRQARATERHDEAHPGQQQRVSGDQRLNIEGPNDARPRGTSATWRRAAPQGTPKQRRWIRDTDEKNRLASVSPNATITTR